LMSSGLLLCAELDTALLPYGSLQRDYCSVMP
jgi:hypothetical protein